MFRTGFGEEGTKPSQFYAPHGIAIDSLGCLYIVDGFNHRIQKFDTKSKAARNAQKIPTKIAGTYKGGELGELRVRDRIAYLIKPTGKVDPKKRWVWTFRSGWRSIWIMGFDSFSWRTAATAC